MHHEMPDTVDLIVARPPIGTYLVTVPAGGKFDHIYYDHKRAQWYAVVHHPIQPGATIETYEIHAGAAIDVGEAPCET